MNTHALVLTRDFAPHKIVTQERALMMLFQGKVEVVEEFEEAIGGIPASRIREFPQVTRALGSRYVDGDLTLFAPSVIRLWKPVTRYKHGAKFSRYNVFTRDGFKCSYCNFSGRLNELNFDHVTPRDKGGKTNWENIVTSCYPCNRKKANRTPEQAGMKLLRQPHKPKYLPMLGPKFYGRDDVAPSWIYYLGESFASVVTSEVA